MVFKNREDAGVKLAEEVLKVSEIGEVQEGEGVVLGIPRGGVGVAKIVAEKLGWPVSIVVTKKVGAPGQTELAVGAMGPDEKIVWDKALMRSLNLSRREMKEQIEDARTKVREYKKKFSVKERDLRGKTVVVVDDGIATGRTVEAAIRYLRRVGVEFIIVAVPVCAKSSAEHIEKLADKLVCLQVESWFRAVGEFYEDFEQVGDEQVGRLLGIGV